MIQSSFLINAIAAKENLKAEESDVDAKIEEYAKTAGIEVARLKGFYGQEENKSRLKFKITEDKVVEFLTQNAALRDVEKAKIKG